VSRTQTPTTPKPTSDLTQNKGEAERARARAAGWHRSDLDWEKLQEAAHAAYEAGDRGTAVRLWRKGAWMAAWRLPKADPRRATSLANAAFADRLLGREDAARAKYDRARALWAEVPGWTQRVEPARRARSSTFHMRMEAKNWDTYKANIQARLGRFAEEAGEALAAIAEGKSSPHRLISRWKGEKPAVFDDSRKLVSAALLIAGPEPASEPAKDAKG